MRGLIDLAFIEPLTALCGAHVIFGLTALILGFDELAGDEPDDGLDDVDDECDHVNLPFLGLIEGAGAFALLCHLQMRGVPKTSKGNTNKKLQCGLIFFALQFFAGALACAALLALAASCFGVRV